MGRLYFCFKNDHAADHIRKKSKAVFTPNAVYSKHVYLWFNVMYTSFTLNLFTSIHLV